MKKNKLLILIVSFFCFCGVVNADVNYGYSENYVNSFKENSCGSEGCLLLCGYTHTMNSSSQGTIKTSSYIFYDYERRNMYIGLMEPYGGISYQNFNSTNYTILMDSTVKNDLLNKGKCPTASYFSEKTGGLCFGDRNYCLNSEGEFTGGSFKNHDYASDIKAYFEYLTIHLEELTLEDVINGDASFDNSTVDIDLNKELFDGHEFTNFMKNSDEFQNGMKKYQETADRIQNDVWTELEELCDSGEITDSECEKYREKVNKELADIKKEAQEYIDYIQSGGNLIDYTKPEEYQSCTSLFNDPDTPNTPAWYISFVFEVIKYGALILLVALTVMDFIGATASQDGDAIKKAANKAMKRLVLCVVLFVLPTLIDFVLQFIHNSSIKDCI